MLFSTYINQCAESNGLWNAAYANVWIYAIEPAMPPADSFSMYCMGGEL